MKNVKIVGEGEGGGETPEPPVEGTEIFTEKFGTKIIGKDEAKPAISAYPVSYTHLLLPGLSIPDKNDRKTSLLKQKKMIVATRWNLKLL